MKDQKGGKVRFIRKNGKLIPIRANKGGSTKVKKSDLPSVKRKLLKGKDKAKIDRLENRFNKHSSKSRFSLGVSLGGSVGQIGGLLAFLNPKSNRKVKGLGAAAFGLGAVAQLIGERNIRKNESAKLKLAKRGVSIIENASTSPTNKAKKKK